MRSEVRDGDEEVEPIVRVVDDDPTLLRSLARLLSAAGLRVETYESAEAFLGRYDGSPGCALLDLQLGESGGLELQETIRKLDEPIPVIFLTGHGDVRSSVRAMKGGAVDFLIKPISAGALLDTVRIACAADVETRRDRRDRAELRARYDILTPREREVFALVARGLLNKQMAAALGTSERTVKAHRANIMRKMALDSVASLARAAERLQSGSAGD